MTDKTMPDEIWAKQYGEASGGTYWSKPREDGKGTLYLRADHPRLRGRWRL